MATIRCAHHWIIEAPEQETKNTFRYQENTNGEPPARGTLHLQK